MIKVVFVLFFLFGLVRPAEAMTTIASWYGREFDGHLMANGHRFRASDPTIVASKWLPFGTRLYVRNRLNGCAATVVVQDRGPYVADRGLDLSQAAAEKLCYTKQGIGWLEVTNLSQPQPHEHWVYWRDMILPKHDPSFRLTTRLRDRLFGFSGAVVLFIPRPLDYLDNISIIQIRLRAQERR